MKSRYTRAESDMVWELVRPYLNADCVGNILDVRCGSGRLTARVAQHCTRARVMGIDSGGFVIQWTRPFLHRFGNATARAQDLRQMRKHSPNRFDLILFMRPPRTFKQTVRASISSLGRSLGHAVDLLRDSGRIIIVRQGIFPGRSDEHIPEEAYGHLLTAYGFTYRMTDEIIVADLKA